MHHKNIVIGDVELSIHEESTIQQDVEHVQQETCVQLDDGNKTIVVGQMELNTHEESTVEQVLNMYSKGHVFNWMMGTNPRHLLVIHVLMCIILRIH